MIPISDTLALDEREIQERFVRASGPGGQNVNKVSTAVELRFDVAASSLPPEVKPRLLAIAGRRAVGGVLVIDSRAHRTQLQNREAARERLVALIQRALARPKRRRATRPTAGAREHRLSTKKRRGEIKKLRSADGGD
jgi:ribosome-associated protein